MPGEPSGARGTTTRATSRPATSATSSPWSSMGRAPASVIRPARAQWPGGRLGGSGTGTGWAGTAVAPAVAHTPTAGPSPSGVINSDARRARSAATDDGGPAARISTRAALFDRAQCRARPTARGSSSAR